MSINKITDELDRSYALTSVLTRLVNISDIQNESTIKDDMSALLNILTKSLEHSQDLFGDLMCSLPR